MIITSLTGGTKGSKSLSLGNDPLRGPTIVKCGSVITQYYYNTKFIRGQPTNSGYGSYSFIVPYGVCHICFAMVGGGGGGSGGGVSQGGGGGGGQVKVGRITAIGGARVDVMLGAGGKAGTNGGYVTNSNSYWCRNTEQFVITTSRDFVRPTKGCCGGNTTITVTCPRTTPPGASPVRGVEGTFVTAYGGGGGGFFNGGHSYHATTSTNYPFFKHCCGPAGRYKIMNSSYRAGGSGTIAGAPQYSISSSNHCTVRPRVGYDAGTRSPIYACADLYCCGGWHRGYSDASATCNLPGAGMSRCVPIGVVNAANVGTLWNTICNWGQGGYAINSGSNPRDFPGRGGNGGGNLYSPCITGCQGIGGAVKITYQKTQNRNVVNELYCNGGISTYAPPGTPAICMQNLRPLAYGYTRRQRTVQCPTYPGLTYVQCYCASNYTDTSPVCFDRLAGACYWQQYPIPDSLPPTRNINAPPGTYLHCATICVTSWGGGGSGGSHYAYGSACSIGRMTGTGGGGGGGITIQQNISVQTVNSTYRVFVGSGSSSYVCLGAGLGTTSAALAGSRGLESSTYQKADGGGSGNSYYNYGRGADGHFGGGGGGGSQTNGANVTGIYCGGYGGLGTLTTIPNLCGGQYLQTYYLGGGGGGGGGAVAGYGTINSSAQPGNQGVSSNFYGGYGGYIVNGVAYCGTFGREGTGQGGGGAPSCRYSYVTVTYPQSSNGGIIGQFFQALGQLGAAILGFIITGGSDSGAIAGAIVASLFPSGSPSNAQITTTLSSVTGRPLAGGGGSGGVYISYASGQDSGNTNANGKLFTGGCSEFYLNGRWHHLFTYLSGNLRGIRPNQA